ncbi:MAG: hypothetical protein GC164_11940 [Phycisphaera sp.]|nr:hypothetical protein [Phycisphaera sp.]
MDITRKFRKLAMGAAVAATVALATPAVHAAEEAGPNTGAISVSAGFDIVTQYWFRGIFQENQGFIIQPWITLNANVFKAEDGPINSVDLNVGIWNSFHADNASSTVSGGASDPTAWYEADLFFGASATVLEDFTVGVTYTAYTSPNGFFGPTPQEISVSFGYDDSGLWEQMGLDGFALNPSALVAFEFTGAGADAGAKDGVYLQIGIAPSFVILPIEGGYDVTLTLPVTFGASLHEYYESAGGPGTSAPVGDDKFFGFVDLGADFSVPLAFMPSQYGSWSAYAGVHVIFYGTSNVSPSSSNTSGSTADCYGKFGVSFDY